MFVSLMVLGLVAALGVRCGGDEDREAGSGGELILASTTSTRDSGLFDLLLPAFSEANPEYRVKLVAVGTGEALRLGERKDADALLVHAPEAEREFVSNGYGTERRKVMYNDFVVVGPGDDPAGAELSSSAPAAFTDIAESGAPFYSRGDDSGTHKKELAVWEEAGMDPGGAWYSETGQGMGSTLRVTSEKQGYTLTDRATFLNLEANLDLTVLVEGDPLLFNQYGVIPVAGAHNQEGAQAFAAWITSGAAQELIADYGEEEFGRALFVPNAQ